MITDNPHYSRRWTILVILAPRRPERFDGVVLAGVRLVSRAGAELGQPRHDRVAGHRRAASEGVRGDRGPQSPPAVAAAGRDGSQSQRIFPLNGHCRSRRFRRVLVLDLLAAAGSWLHADQDRRRVPASERRDHGLGDHRHQQARARSGPPPLMVAGIAARRWGMLYVARLTVAASYATGTLPALIMLGIGLGLVFSTSINSAPLGVEPADAGVASASVSAAQQIGGSLGTALLSTIAASALSSYITSAHAHLSGLLFTHAGCTATRRPLRGLPGSSQRARWSPESCSSAGPMHSDRRRGHHSGRPLTRRRSRGSNRALVSVSQPKPLPCLGM